MSTIRLGRILLTLLEQKGFGEGAVVGIIMLLGNSPDMMKVMIEFLLQRERKPEEILNYAIHLQSLLPPELQVGEIEGIE